MIILSGNSNHQLASKIADYLKLPLGKALVGTFADGEIKIEIDEQIAGKEVFIIQSTCPPVNHNLMELLLLADAVRRADAAKITAILPYFGYSRQDKIAAGVSPVSARLVADLIAAAGVNRVITLDIHSDQSIGFFNMPIINLTARPAFINYLKQNNENFIIVSPDAGGVKRARAYANELKTELAVISKKRDVANRISSMQIIGEVRGKNVLIIDDLIDTGRTLVEAAKALKENGANTISVCATHAVLSGETVKLIESSELSEVIVSDSIPLNADAKNSSKFKIVSVAEILASSLK